MLKEMKTGLCLLIFMTLLTGGLYPLLITGVAQLCFPWQASGSLIEHRHQTIGSALIGQSFTSPNYFWGRPSETRPFPYTASGSAGANHGPMSPVFLTTVKNRITLLKGYSSDNLIPVDLVTASASGLDPDISPFAAFYQVRRVAMARGLSEITLEMLITEHITHRSWHLFGEPRVNVLQLNLAMDALHEH